MKCPECSAWTVVLETRYRRAIGVTRRRECGNGHRFTTREQVVAPPPIQRRTKDKP